MIGVLIAGTFIIALLIGLGIGFVFRNAQLKSAQADSQSLIEMLKVKRMNSQDRLRPRLKT